MAQYETKGNPGTVPGRLLLTFLLSLVTVSGQTAGANSWTKPTSGNWDDASAWSLGVRPNSSQSVLIANSGWKAVAINPSTPINFPNSMTVDTLTIRGAWDTFNTLLLNHAGNAVPLTVLNGLEVADSARILNFHSALVVQGGTIVVTNAQIIQDGGLVRTTNAPMYLHDSAYHITNGVLEMESVVLASTASTFNQTGGFVTGGSRYRDGMLHIAAGTYRLAGGLLQVPGLLAVPSTSGSTPAGFDGAFVQTGGTNEVAGGLSVHAWIAGERPGLTQNVPGRYILSNGVLRVAGGGGADAGGDFQQWGGWHTNDVTVVRGYSWSGLPGGPLVANFTLGGGTLETPGILMEDVSRFLQSGGINRVSGGVSVGFLGTFTLSGGLLTARSTSVVPGSFVQSGGTHRLSNELMVSGYWPLERETNGYTLSGGELITPAIQLFGKFHHLGGFLSTNNLTINGGIWNEQTGGQQFGTLELGLNGGTISFPSRLCQIQFADSSGGFPWHDPFGRKYPVLVIQGWNGSTNGGGQHQIRFGSSSAGLTSGQLGHIRFNLSGRFYPARILATGEVVPGPRPVLSVTRSSNSMVISWSGNYQLLTSTNVLGPYTVINGATSPYAVSFGDPRRFFYLRSP